MGSWQNSVNTNNKYDSNDICHAAMCKYTLRCLTWYYGTCPTKTYTHVAMLPES